jgi:leucyl/phenylalanyl-tRNA--protein transferase
MLSSKVKPHDAPLCAIGQSPPLDGPRPRDHVCEMSGNVDPHEITPQVLLRAYSIGMFPMAEDADDPTLFWVDPEMRGVFPLDGLIVSKSLAKLVRSDRFAIHVDRDFNAVIEGCSGGGDDRPKTWINARIRRLYGDLFHKGFVHTVEVYDEADALVGGLYGVAIGAAFFGESMFHRARDASKVALVHLVARLRAGGVTLLDTQFVTPHLATLGAVEITRNQYHRQLDAAIGMASNFYIWPKGETVPGARALAALGETGFA